MTKKISPIRSYGLILLTLAMLAAMFPGKVAKAGAYITSTPSMVTIAVGGNGSATVTSNGGTGGSLYIKNNSSPSIYTAALSGSALTIAGVSGQNGSGAITICLNGGSYGNDQACGSVTVMVGAKSPTPPGSIMCSDDPSRICGSMSVFNLQGTCELWGTDQFPDPRQGNAETRIYGGEVCSNIPGQNVTGYYRDYLGNPVLYTDGPMMPSWNYFWDSGSSLQYGFQNYPAGTYTYNIPTGYFQDPTDTYHIYKIFGDGSTTMSLSTQPPDDQIALNFGTLESSWGGCQYGAPYSDDPAGSSKNVYDATCNKASLIYNGGVSGLPIVNGDFGLPLSLKVTNLLRPNGHSSAQWGGGTGYVSFQNVTQCYSKAMITYLNGLGEGYKNVTDYYPTSPGVCAPSTGSALSGGLQVTFPSGSDTTTLSVPANAAPATVNFQFSNNGQSHSTTTVPDGACNPSVTGGNLQISNITKYCPGATLVAP